MTTAPSRLDRFLAALPLSLLYLGFAALYAWQAGERLTPTIFSDELELAQISRSIAETGEAARRGEAYSFQTLYAVVLAPVWWIDDTRSAYEAAKLVGVLVMTATIFPAYALARLLVAKPWALFVAAGSVAIPGMAYAPFLLEEPLAYPVATAGLWLILRFVLARDLATLAPALAVCVVAPFVRAQLAVLAATLALCLLAIGWSAGPIRRWRATWTGWDRAGAAALGVGAAIVLNAFISHRSDSWYVTTTFYKGRLLEYGLWAVGALALGLGLLPLVGGLAALAARAERETRAFAVTAGAAMLTFGLYTAVKAAYLSTNFATRVAERNLIYLAPLLLAGTALLLERPRARLWAVAAAGAFTLWLVLTTPFVQDYPYGDAPSLSMAALANREFRWDAPMIERMLVVVLLVGVAALLARTLIRSRAAVVVGAAAAVLVVAWSLTAEIYAAAGNETSARQLYANLPGPPNWLDEETDGEPAAYLGQSIGDANGIWLLEFWNRSLDRVWSLDGSAPGPGPTLSPDLAAPDGTLSPSPGTRWVVAETDVNLAAQKVGEPRGALQLYRLDGPLRLESSTSGLYGDGWTGPAAAYNRYAAPGVSQRGFARVYLTNPFCPAAPLRQRVTVRTGPVVVRRNQPALGSPAQVRRTTLDSCGRAQTILVPASIPFRIELEIEPFVPATIDERSSDARALGARVDLAFIPL